jgi:hypothetical protein
MTTTTMQTLTGSDRNDVVRQISEMLGSEGTREMAARMYDALGGRYVSEARACVVSYTDAQWAAAASRPLNRIGEPSTDAEMMADAEASRVELERVRGGGLR